MATRRSHIVRVYDDSSGEVNKSAYIDVEVLDAISFKIARGEEVILNFPSKKASPFIVDDTGNGLAKQPNSSTATRRSHVEHIKGENGELLVEVLDAIAFKDKRGEEWVLKMPAKKASPFNATKGTGSGETTRRTHNEKIGTDPTVKDPDADYLTVERSDMISFRSVRGREMILKMPSNDKGGKPGRASTFISSPKDYDPTDDSDENAPPENKDPDFYVKFVKDQSPLTGDELISQGPLWWIRKVSGPNILFLKIDLNRTNFGDTIKMLDNPDAGIHGPVNVEGDLTTNGAKKMPTDPAATPKLNLKDDTYWTGNKNPNDSASDGKWTALIWFNVSKIRKGLDKGATIELKFTVPSVSRGKSTGKIGNYLWVTGAVQPWFLHQVGTNLKTGETSTFTPIDQTGFLEGGAGGYLGTMLPFPTKDTAFTPLEDHLTTGNLLDYILLENPWGSFDSFYRSSAGAYATMYTATGIQSLDDFSEADKSTDSFMALFDGVTDFPGSNSAGSQYGFQTAEGAAKWISCYQAWIALINVNAPKDRTIYYPSLSGTRQPGDNASLHSWADPPDGGVIDIVPISIDFGGTEPPKYRSLSTTFTATLLHKTAYSYDAQNVIGFDLPADPDKAPTLTLNQTPGTNGKIVTLKLDKSGKVTLTSTDNPDDLAKL
jgi:hypothetical protein